MTRSELVRRLADSNPRLTQRDAEVIVTVIFDEITAALLRGDRVELRRLGTFSIRKFDARIGRNPRTGESVAISQKHRIYFRIAKPLHDRLQKQLTA